jgi:hypothetical protein
MKELKVTDQHRTNELSLTPGGGTVKILHEDGRLLVYDKVKSVRSYVSAALKRDTTIVQIWCDDIQVWPPQQPTTSQSVF